LLKLEHISYIVKDSDGNEKTILKDINLEIGDSETVVVTGHNGSGKSTLMKIIMSVENTFDIHINDEEIVELRLISDIADVTVRKVSF
jgi:ABC-type lipoprotein export system ATPase subunit